ncbi:hypothetical protein NL676_030423 [Syzygium grande]|nr:hypothetical protein NL676_030423 [Syzygium grande]
MDMSEVFPRIDAPVETSGLRKPTEQGRTWSFPMSLISLQGSYGSTPHLPRHRKAEISIGIIKVNDAMRNDDRIRDDLRGVLLILFNDDG